MSKEVVTRTQIEQQIAMEITQYSQETGSNRFGYINNFRNLLRKTDRESFDNPRHLLKTETWGKETFGEVYRNAGRDPKEYGFSDRFIDQTPRSWFQEIDEAMIEESVLGEDVEQLDSFANENVTDQTKYESYRDILYRYIFPVYVNLRLRGYNHKELTS